jgi:hypothetical protein
MKSPETSTDFSIPSAFQQRLAAFPVVLVAMSCLMALLAASGADNTVDPKSLPAPKRVVVPKLNGVLTVDGDLNEPVWGKAAVLTPFLLNDGSGPEREKTVVRLWYDDTALYLGWACSDSDIQATFTARDSKFWEEEVVEFFVTSKTLERYFELQWNPLGGIFDATIDNKLDHQGVSTNFTGDWSFTAKGMQSAVKAKGTVGNANDKDDSWQVEVVVPFADLGELAPKPGAVWRANFYRFNRAKDQSPELLSWSPTRFPSFHQPARFGHLEFGK